MVFVLRCHHYEPYGWWLVTSVGKAEDIEAADQRLQSFMKDLIPELPAYLPGKSVAE
jgi:hypothetical protein